MSNSWLFEEQGKGIKLSIKIKKTLASIKSKYQLIEIFDTASHGIIMMLDHKFMITQKDEFVYHEMISHIPLYSRESPQMVLIIGGGDGAAVRECVKHKSIKEIHLCEIDSDVVKLSKKFLKFATSGLKDRRCKVFIEDGFSYLRNYKGQKYDLVIVDSTDPVGFAKKLFGIDFFKLVKNVLTKDGIICCQSESPFFYAKTISNTNDRLSKIFKYVSHFTAPITTYPSGYWSFAIASDKKMKFNNKNYLKNYIRKDYKFYNKNIHISSFCLPNFFEDLLK